MIFNYPNSWVCVGNAIQLRDILATYMNRLKANMETVEHRDNLYC